MKRLLAAHPHKLATLHLSDTERRPVVERHFGLDEEGPQSGPGDVIER